MEGDGVQQPNPEVRIGAGGQATSPGRPDWFARCLAVLGLGVAAYGACAGWKAAENQARVVKIQSQVKEIQQQQAKIQEYNSAPFIKFEDVVVDPTNPALLTPGANREQAMRQNAEVHTWPRSLSYKGKIKNAGGHVITVWNVLLCIRNGGGEAAARCDGSYSLTQGSDIVLQPNEEQEFEFDCQKRMIDREKDCFFGIEQAEIFIVARVRGIGDDLVSFQHRIYGYRGDVPVLKVEARG
jgi:hypothetical protein